MLVILHVKETKTFAERTLEYACNDSFLSPYISGGHVKSYYHPSTARASSMAMSLTRLGGLSGCMADAIASMRHLHYSKGFHLSARVSRCGNLYSHSLRTAHLFHTSTICCKQSINSATLRNKSKLTLDPGFFSTSHELVHCAPANIETKVVANYRPATNNPLDVRVTRDNPVPSTHISVPPSGYIEQRSRTWAQIFRVYRQLSKSRLTFLVVLSGMMGYALCPSSLCFPTYIPSVVRLLALAGGITLCSTAANTLNQIVEAPYDAQMARTRARPLPRRAISPAHAFGLATVCATSGVVILGCLNNPLTAMLGALNIVLYSFVYTPLKRHSVVNTWVGAVVGMIPPLMGWASCTNSLFRSSDATGWILGAILFAWQFPHFNALSHVMGSEYARGGYRMMAVTNPSLNRRVAFRYSLVLIPLCSVALPLTGTVQALPYAVLSLIPNVLFAYYSGRFWGAPSDKTARACFWFSLFHLPAVMVLAMACKGDLWDNLLGKTGNAD